MHRYVTNPAVKLLAVSPNEVSAQGSPLDGYALLVSDDERRGLARAVLDALEAPATADELHARLADPRVGQDELVGYLTTLVASGVLLRLEHDRAADDDLLAYKRFGEVRIPAATARLFFVGGDLASLLAERLAALGFETASKTLDDLDVLDDYRAVERDPDDPAVDPELRLVVVPDEVSVARLHEFNARAVAADVPVLYLTASGVQYAVGPFVDPGRSSCFWEFERLHARTLDTYAPYAAHASANGAATPRTIPRVTADALAAAATPFLVELALTGTSELGGKVVRGRSTSAETSRHSVMRVPRCPVCMPKRPPIRNPLY